MAGNSVPVEVVRDLFNYDPETGIVTWRRKGVRSAVIGQRVGYAHSAGYLQVYFTGYYPQVLHRIAWAITHGEWPPVFIDHINGVKDDNRLCNLRLATDAQNHQNLKRARKDNLSGFLGVTRSRARFVATIAWEGKRKYLGVWPTAEEAHAAYIEAKRKLHPFGTL